MLAPGSIRRSIPPLIGLLTVAALVLALAPSIARAGGDDGSAHVAYNCNDRMLPEPWFPESEYQPVEHDSGLALRPWSLFIWCYYDKPPGDEDSRDTGLLGEVGIEIGTPTFVPGIPLFASVALAVGGQGFAEPGDTDPSSPHVSATFMAGAQLSNAGEGRRSSTLVGAIHIAVWFRLDAPFQPIRYSDGTPLFGNSGTLGMSIGGLVRLVGSFRVNGTDVPGSLSFLLGANLGVGEREVMVGADFGSLLLMGVVLVYAALGGGR